MKNNNNLEFEVASKLKERLTNLSIKTKFLKNFQLFKSEYYWLTKEFDQQIDNFYLHEVFEKTNKIALSKFIQDEISLYFWVKANDFNHLKLHWKKIFEKLKILRSEMTCYFQFYQDKFQNQNQNWKFVYSNFLLKWESLIVERIVNFKLFETLQMRQKFILMWTNNIKIIPKIKNLIAFVWNFFGKFWEGDFNDFKKVNLSILVKYSRILDNNPAIMELTRILGRAKGRSDIVKTEIREKKVIQYVPMPVNTWPEEVIGIVSGKELEYISPIEVVNLALPELNIIFYKRLIEEKLAITEFEATDLQALEVVVKEKVKVYLPESEGPIIICIDTSKSMKGASEIIAKSIALAVVKSALEQKRPCYMINFSGVFETYDLSSLNASLENLLHFLGHSFLGQTNINPVFDHVLKLMVSKAYRNADLLLISDFMCSNLLQEQIDEMQALQTDRNRFFAINVAPVNFFNNWSMYFNGYFNYDPRDPWAVRKILHEINVKVKKG